MEQLNEITDTWVVDAYAELRRAEGVAPWWVVRDLRAFIDERTAAGCCVVARCRDARVPGQPWCEGHRPAFEREAA